MKRITEIDEHIAVIRPKIDLGTTDWTKGEKESIEKCYFEITKVSTGAGRTVDLGCSDCVNSAVNIVKNYLALIANEAPEQKAVQPWSETIKTVEAEAKRIGFDIPENAKLKADKIAAVEAVLELRKQLVSELLKEAGVEVNPDEYTLSQLNEMSLELLEDEDAAGAENAGAETEDDLIG